MYQALAQAFGDCFRACRRAQFAEDRLGMKFYRVLRNVEAPRNLFVAQAVAQRDQNLELARRERGGRLVLLESRKALSLRCLYAQSRRNRAQRGIDLTRRGIGGQYAACI